MSRLRMAAVAACGSLVLFSVQAAASDPAQCWRSYEVEAAKVRDLHIMLMLGALKCKSIDSGVSDKYTAFLDKKKGLLASYNGILKAHFMRVNGIADGHRAFEEFNTRLGNNHSGAVQTRNYCQMTDTLLTLATDARDRELPLLAQNFSEDSLAMEECEAVAAPVATDPSAPTTASPVTVAKADGAASSSPPSAAAALEAAAVALQTAAASLKGQPASPDPAAQTPIAEPAADPGALRPVADASKPSG